MTATPRPYSPWTVSLRNFLTDSNITIFWIGLQEHTEYRVKAKKKVWATFRLRKVYGINLWFDLVQNSESEDDGARLPLFSRNLMTPPTAATIEARSPR